MRGETSPPEAGFTRWGHDARSASITILAVTMTWIALKSVAWWAWVLLPGEYSDTYYYFLTAQEQMGVAAFPEYPTPAAWLLGLPYGLGADDHESYRLVIMVATSVADGLFALLLGRRTGPVGVLGWMVLTTVLGQVALLRFDMLPAIAAAAALLLSVHGKSRWAAVLVAVGTALKVWPIIVAPIVIFAARRRVRTTVWFGVSGLVLVLVSVAVGGWDRLLAPLTHQTDRGLQIESVAATLPMRAWATEPGWTVWYSPFHAFEVMGPGVDTWLQVANVLGVVAALGCLVLVGFWVRWGCRREALPYLALTGIGAFIVTSPALSPQYLLWLAAPTAVLLGLATGPKPTTPVIPATLTWVGAVVLCLLTTAVYPVNYEGLTALNDLTPRAITMLTLRNVGLLVFVAWTATLAQVTARRPPEESASPQRAARISPAVTASGSSGVTMSTGSPTISPPR